MAIVSWFLIFFTCFFLSGTDIDYTWGVVAISAVIILVAFKKKYIEFKQNDWKQNIISAIFLICTIGWFYWAFCRSIIIGISFTSWYYGF